MSLAMRSRLGRMYCPPRPALVIASLGAAVRTSKADSRRRPGWPSSAAATIPSRWLKQLARLGRAVHDRDLRLLHVLVGEAERRHCARRIAHRGAAGGKLLRSHGVARLARGRRRRTPPAAAASPIGDVAARAPSPDARGPPPCPPPGPWRSTVRSRGPRTARPGSSRRSGRRRTGCRTFSARSSGRAAGCSRAFPRAQAELHVATTCASTGQPLTPIVSSKSAQSSTSSSVSRYPPNTRRVSRMPICGAISTM